MLTAIAAGRTRHNEIHDATGADPSRTLDRLVELRIIERLLPVTEQGTRSRRRVYRIADNYLAFYLGPLMRFRAEIERGLGKSIISALEASGDQHMGPVYEEAFREYLRRAANEGQLGEKIVAVGSWWRDDGDQQIDAVVLAQRDLIRVPVLAGESKWARSVNAARIKAGLIRKAASPCPGSEPAPVCRMRARPGRARGHGYPRGHRGGHLRVLNCRHVAFTRPRTVVSSALSRSPETIA